MYAILGGAQNGGSSSGGGPILILFAVAIALGVWAVYLSWTTNTRMGYEVPDKLLYAFGAGIFGPFYIAHYYIVRADCNCLPNPWQPKSGPIYIGSASVPA